MGSVSRHDILKWGQTKTNVRVFKVRLNFHAQTALTPFGMGSPDCMPWNVADLVLFSKALLFILTLLICQGTLCYIQI